MKMMTLEEIVELATALRTFDINNFVGQTFEDSAIVDLKRLLAEKEKLPIKSFAVDAKKRLLRILFFNGQSLILNESKGWYEVGTQGAVYLIRSVDGFYKIGYSTDPKARIVALQTSTPNELTLVKWWYHPNSIKIEHELHRFFKKKRVSGEWFALTVEDIETIESYFDESDE
jgi:hypothetical protein